MGNKYGKEIEVKSVVEEMDDLGEGCSRSVWSGRCLGGGNGVDLYGKERKFGKGQHTKGRTTDRHWWIIRLTDRKNEVEK